MLRQSWRAAFPFTLPFMPSPAIFVFAPVPFVGLFVPFVSVVPFPPRRRLTTPFPPLRRGHPVVADRDLENSHVGQYLRLMHRMQGFDALHFDDHSIRDDEIRSILADDAAFVVHGNADLSSVGKRDAVKFDT